MAPSVTCSCSNPISPGSLLAVAGKCPAVAPDLPENVARFRLGNDVVDSRVYIDLKRMYESRFSALKTAYEARINFIMHDESLHSETGFVKSGYSGNLPWDIHPQSSFYVDGMISQKIRNVISS